MTKIPDNSALIRAGGTERIIKNVRMRNSILLVAQAFMGDTPPGITHLALGSGIGSGTLALPQEAHENRTSLRQEFHRQPITTIRYHDLQNEEGDTYTDGTRSNRILVEGYVPPADAVGLITEVGLFGGVNGQDMIAWVTFPVVDNRGENPESFTFNWLLSFPFIQPTDGDT